MDEEIKTQSNDPNVQRFYDARSARQNQAIQSASQKALNMGALTSPSADLKLPTQPVNSKTATGIVGSVQPTPEKPEQSMVDPQVTNDLQSLANEITSKRGILDELGLSDITETFARLQGKGAFEAKISEETGLNDKNQLLTDIDNQIIEKRSKFGRELERIEAQTGLTEIQKQSKIANIEIGRAHV